jgi:hypothetical protein
MIELTPDQHEALKKSGLPARLRDPQTNAIYVVLGEEEYNQLKELLIPGPLTERERQTIIQGVWQRANWDDPLMDDYDNLAARENS